MKTHYLQEFLEVLVTEDVLSIKQSLDGFKITKAFKWDKACLEKILQLFSSLVNRFMSRELEVSLCRELREIGVELAETVEEFIELLVSSVDLPLGVSSLDFDHKIRDCFLYDFLSVLRD